MTVQKYSKSSGFYHDSKARFFEQNDALLEAARSKNALFAAQPHRKQCKLCEAPLAAENDFVSHGVGYLFCSDCGHLNGRNEDTREFVEEIYISDEGADYSKNYVDADYEKRARDIYLPKVDFLRSNMPSQPFSVLDVGCGAGYFVAACGLRSIPAHGIDVSRSMVDFGNDQIAQLLGTSDKLQTHVEESDFFDRVATTDAAVVSAIGVIEHLREPHAFFEAFRRSSANFLFYSVPMFSFSTILENMLNDLFPRQLSGAHTHLFTESSLKKMHELIGGTARAEWRFGTDMMDLYRAAMTMLEKGGASDEARQRFASAFAPQIDKLQTALDEGHFCSEIHVLVEKSA